MKANRPASAITGEGRMKGVVIIEDITSEGTEWGVSLCGPNPELSQYVECEGRDDAVRTKAAMDIDYVTCPFCGENDFDHIGLKRHLLRYCLVFMGVDNDRS